MALLDLNHLVVESFPTLESPMVYMAPPPDTREDCDEVYFMPVTAHTDPCDPCCNTELTG